jgi:outer membrane protein assembly factor BamB
MDGKPVWSQKATPVKTRTGFGSAASPILHGDRVIHVNDNDEQSYIAAYDKRTGKELWRTGRDEGSNWATPFVWQNDRRTEIVTAGTGKIRSYDLDGKLLWELKGMSIYAIPTPFAADGLLYIASGYPADKIRPVYAIRSGAMGDISLKPNQTSNDFIVWSDPAIGPYNPTPLVYQGCYYTLLDRGFLTCHDPKTGKEIYGRQRITMDATSFTASLWAYNGKVFALSEDGDTYVMAAGPEFKALGKNSLGEMSLSTPAVANGGLIIRTASRLYRIGHTK